MKKALLIILAIFGIASVHAQQLTAYQLFKQANYDQLKSTKGREYKAGPPAINITCETESKVFRVSYNEYDDDVVYIFILDKQTNVMFYDFMPVFDQGLNKTIQRIALELVKKNIHKK